MITLEKNYKIRHGFAVAKKAPSLWKKNFSKKNCCQLICVNIIFKTLCGIFFKRNDSRDTSVSVILRFRKLVLHNKIMNKTRSTKNWENSAHCLGDNYIKNHLVKFLHDQIGDTGELELLEYALAITCFRKNC